MLMATLRGQLGYIVACAMGFASIYYGFAADGDASGSMHYNSDKAELVSIPSSNLSVPW